MSEADLEAQRTFDEVQREKAELGLPSVPEEKTPVDETKVEVKTESTEEVKTETEVEVDEAKQVSDKEEKKEIVPPKEYKDYKARLREELQKDFDAKLEKLKLEYRKETPNETKKEDLEDDVTKLAKELDFDVEKTRKLIEVARKGVELSPEDKQALQEYRSLKEEREELKAKEEFNNEWKENLTTIKSQFPNASEEQLEKAKSLAEDLARDPESKYLDKELDYILFREKDKFNEILFSPKQRTFESSKNQPINDETDNEFPEFRPDMTPAQFERFEKRREKMAEGLGREKMVLKTTDDSGRVIERMV